MRAISVFDWLCGESTRAGPDGCAGLYTDDTGVRVGICGDCLDVQLVDDRVFAWQYWNHDTAGGDYSDDICVCL